MSLQDMLDEEPPCTLMRQATLNNTDAGGIPINNLVPLRPIQGRVKKLSARQTESWLSQGIKAVYEFITLDMTVDNGDVINVPANEFYPQGRFFRVVGPNGEWEAKGTIETHVSIPMEELRKRGALFVAVSP